MSSEANNEANALIQIFSINILAGIDLMHIIRKGQMMMEGAAKMSFAEQFYALAR